MILFFFKISKPSYTYIVDQLGVVLWCYCVYCGVVIVCCVILLRLDEFWVDDCWWDVVSSDGVIAA